MQIDPIYPAPPVTKTFMARKLRTVKQQLNGEITRGRRVRQDLRLREFGSNHIIYLMTANATVLYRQPERVFAAADRGETVIIRRNRSEYLLTRKPGSKKLYGCLTGTIKQDKGKPAVSWKAVGRAST